MAGRGIITRGDFGGIADTLDENALQSGQEFLKGKASSVFEATAGLEQAALASAIVPIVVGKVTAEVTGHLAKRTADMLKFDAGAIASEAAKKMSQYINPGEIMKQLTTSAEGRHDDLEKNNLKEEIAEMQKKISDTVGVVKGKVDEILEPVEEGVQSIVKYAGYGSEWVVMKTDDLATKIVDSTIKFIDNQADQLQHAKDEYIISTADKQAQKMAEKINIKTRESMQIALKQADALKQFAITNAKALIAAALLKVKGMLGG